MFPTAGDVAGDGDSAAESVRRELGFITEVDRAHLVMLAERGIVDTHAAALVASEIERLRSVGFAPLLGREARRGTYLLYEDWLATRLGSRTAGILRTGRSRNDLNATVFLLRLRTPYRRLMTELTRLQAILLGGARRHRSLVMPAYTHFQPAVPITFGHYLGGVAHALDRDIAPVADAGAALGRCPLGAGAGGGTGVRIDTARTAQLLGFDEPVAHSLDAVAGREPALRLLAGAAVLGVTLSRLASDLSLWTTAEFGLVALPDEVVGSSSLMPQKRNPFLLEHAKGRAAAPLGAFVAAAASMHATPFANSVAVGTEACSHVPRALADAADAAALLRVVVAAARPDAAAMRARAVAGHTTATALADRIVTEEGLSFLEAHHLVGATLTAAATPGGTAAGTERDLAGAGAAAAGATLPDPADVAAAARFGAGPGAPLHLDGLRRRRAEWVAESAARAARWNEASRALDDAVETLLASAGATSPRSPRPSQTSEPDALARH